MGGLGAAGEMPGPEDKLIGRKRQAETTQQLAGGRSVGDDQPAGLGGSLEVHVAEGPAKSGGRGRRELEGDDEHRFRVLAQDIARRGGLVDDVAVAQRAFQLEPEIGPVFSDRAPASPGHVMPVRADGDLGQGRIRRDERMADETQHGSEQIVALG